MPNPRQDEPSATGYKAIDKAAEAAGATANEAANAVEKEARTFSEGVRQAADGAARAGAGVLGAIDPTGPDSAAISQATQAVASRVREFSNEWIQALRDQAAKNLEGVAKLAACRSPFDLLRLQTELAREGVSDSVALARRLNSASLRALGAIAQDSAKAATPPAPPR